MKLNFLAAGRLRMKKGIYVPGAERGETIDLPVSSALIRHKQGNVLFDTGCHPCVVDDAEGRWGPLAKVMKPTMGAEETLEEESFEAGLLEYPHYTRPAEWCGRQVPDVLMSGHHEKIRAWRKLQAEQTTESRRPDLWAAYQKRTANAAQSQKKGRAS